MSIYYPQGALILNVRWEDFGTGDEILDKEMKIPVSARTLNVEINDYNEADKFKATVDYNSFPFDPRCIRSMGVTICMEDRKGMYIGNSLDIIVPSEDNIVFLGFADESSISFDDNAQTIDIEGRDYTSLFIDAKRVNTSHISLGKPVDQIIQDIINEQEATKSIKIENRSGEDLPVLSKIAPDFNPATSVKNQKRKETYWDIIQNIISRTALIGYIDLDKFIIDKPQNIYQKKNMKQFIYGRNVKDLKFTRRLGRLKNFNVKVLSLNVGKKTVLEAKIPLEAINPNIAGPEVTIPQLDKDGKKIEPSKVADYITFRIPEINSKDELIKIGESIFEEMSRQQIEGSLSTLEMEIPEEQDRTSKGFVKTEPVGFNKVRNGTAINIYFNMDETNFINSAAEQPQKLAFLTKRGYPKEIAQAFSSSLNRINTPFYVKSVTFNLSQDDGFKMDIEFINFIDLDNALLGK